MLLNLFITIIFSIISAAITHLININLKQGPVKASAGLAFVVALLDYFFPELSICLGVNLPLIVIGASFVGMSADRVLKNWRQTALSGAIFGFIFANSKRTHQRLPISIKRLLNGRWCVHGLPTPALPLLAQQYH